MKLLAYHLLERVKIINFSLHLIDASLSSQFWGKFCEFMASPKWFVVISVLLWLSVSILMVNCLLKTF